MALIGLGVALLSGAFPALYFASVKALDATRPCLARAGGLRSRGLLIGGQMLLTISVVAGMLLMYRQMEHLNSQPLGFEKTHKLDITVSRTGSGSEFRMLLERLTSHPAIRQASMSEVFPGSLVASQPVTIEGVEEGAATRTLDWYIVDEHYLDTLGIALLEGRNFELYSQLSTEVDVYPYLVNETLIRDMGWEEPLGKELAFQVSGTRGRVIGVVEDFNFRSLHEPIRPLVLEPFYDDYRWRRHLLLDLDPLRLPEALAHAESVMREFAPGVPFQYRFLDQTLDSLYQADRRQMRLIGAGAVVCVLITLLGLTGLSAYLLDQRTKEIGIRRVLGASLPTLFTQRFGGLLLLIPGAALLAALLVLPLAGAWLESFAYRVALSPWIVVQAAGAVLLLAVAMALLQLLLLGRHAPARALRYE